jgi:tRNA(Arg) A34 adenosine deaminase TadA
MHHTLCVHSSPPNRADDRRIGLGISYVPTRVRHNGTVPVSAMLVRGDDRFGHFILENDPTGNADADAAAHAEAYARYRAAYVEQVRLHER